MFGRPLDDEDAARLGMETPENPMVITAILFLDGELGLDALLGLVEERLLVHERLRARVVRPGFFRRPRWVEGERSARRNVSHAVLPPRASREDLTDLVSDLMSEPLDPSLPPWRIWLVDGLEEGSVLVLRIHHAIADGVALLGVLFGFSDEGALASIPVAPPRAPPGTSSLRERATALVRLVRRTPAPRAFRRRLAGKKRLAWTAPVEVEHLRKAAHALDAHGNDVLLGILSGALAELTHERGRAVPALVPVALPHDGDALGNRFVSVFVELPVGAASPVERVRAARDGMRRARAEGGLSLGRALVTVASRAGGRVERLAVQLVSRKAALVAVDLVGPPIPLHVGGRAIRDIVYASPPPGTVGLSANAFSYKGQLRMTIAADVAVIPDPARVARVVESHARDTLRALLALA